MESSARTADIVIAHAASSADFALGRALFEEYAGAIDVDLCFQNFAAELERLPEMYGPPSGCLLLARAGGELAGCVGVRMRTAEVCEMKRLYVRPAFRGLKLGRLLADEIARRASSIGYRTIVLDTLDTMHAALALYDSMGFEPATAYYANPLPNVKYLSLDLKRSA
jgi:putative acetyltransferase